MNAKKNKRAASVGGLVFVGNRLAWRSALGLEKRNY
jgi:hypothetical protein